MSISAQIDRQIDAASNIRVRDRYGTLVVIDAPRTPEMLRYAREGQERHELGRTGDMGGARIVESRR